MFAQHYVFDLGPKDSLTAIDFTHNQQVGLSFMCAHVCGRLDLAPQHIPTLEQAIAALKRKVAKPAVGTTEGQS